MQPVVSNSRNKPLILGENKQPSTESKVQKAIVPNLEQLVSNMQHVSCKALTHVPEVYIPVDTHTAIQNALNLKISTQPKMTTKRLDPAEFFKQMGCNQPPATCQEACLKDFYKLTESCLLTNVIYIRSFLDFHVYSTLKMIEKKCPGDLKPMIQNMMSEWAAIRARATYSITFNGAEHLSYIKEAGLFHRKLRENKVPSFFPKEYEKLEQNYRFLLQFIGKDYQSFLSTLLLSQLSGTHDMDPKRLEQIPAVLKNLQSYAEFMHKSISSSKNNKALPHDSEILKKVSVLIQNLEATDNLQEACKNFRQECEIYALKLMERFFVICDLGRSEYVDGEGSVDDSFVIKQILLQPNHTTREKMMGLIMQAELIYELSQEIVQRSILSVLDSEYVLDELYKGRIDLVLTSLFNEKQDVLEGILDGETVVKKSELASFLESEKQEFFLHFSDSNFIRRVDDYLSSTKYSSNPVFVHFCIKKLYEKLKPITEKTVASLKQGYSIYSQADMDSMSLFNETGWLAKALLLVHDMGMYLQDPTVSQDIEFHPDYIELIYEFDPSVRVPSQKTDATTEIKRAPSPPAKRTVSPQAPSPKQQPVVLSKSAVAPQPTVAPSLTRGELKDAIRTTQGDLRKMSRTLRDLLGWSIEHNGKRHPTILDQDKRPVAPIPTTGHAGLGTLLNVANTVADAAESQGLI